jgi:hypothetical protein
MDLHEVKALCYTTLLRPRKKMSIDESTRLKQMLGVVLFVPDYRRYLDELFRWSDNHQDDVDNRLRDGFVQVLGISALETIFTNSPWKTQLKNVIDDCVVLRNLFDYPRMRKFRFGITNDIVCHTEIYSMMTDDFPSLPALIIANRIDHSDFSRVDAEFMPTHEYPHYVKDMFTFRCLIRSAEEKNDSDDEAEDDEDDEDELPFKIEDGNMYAAMGLREICYQNYAYRLSNAIKRDKEVLPCPCGSGAMKYVRGNITSIIIALEQSFVRQDSKINLPVGVLLRIMSCIWDFPDEFYTGALKAVETIRANKRLKEN